MVLMEGKTLSSKLREPSVEALSATIISAEQAVEELLNNSTESISGGRNF